MSAAERRITIGRRRLPGWLDRYRRNHPDTEVSSESDRVLLTSRDGARATIAVPFPPLPVAPDQQHTDPLTGLLEHVARDRRVGVLLVRRGGHAVGIFVGDDLIASKIGGGYVQGTTKAGGWSQQRYARRRANQTRQVFEAAADLAVRLLLPHAGDLDALVTGGHHDGVDAVLADRRLSPLLPLVRPGLIDTPDPRLRVLQQVGVRMLEVTIELNPLA